MATMHTFSSLLFIQDARNPAIPTAPDFRTSKGDVTIFRHPNISHLPKIRNFRLKKIKNRMKRNIFPAILLWLTGSLFCWSQTHVYEMSEFGIVPNKSTNLSGKMEKALQKIRKQATKGEAVILRFRPGTYHFHPQGAAIREYYVSNHDQVTSKAIGMALDGFQSLTLEGNGAQFIFHGRMLPLALTHSSGCTLKDFSIDHANPQIAQIQITGNDADKGITFKVAPWVNYRITRDSLFETYGEGWALRPNTGIAFEEKTRRVCYNTSDLNIPTKGITELEPGILLAPQWKDKRLIPGTVVAMRTWERPTPGIFLSHDAQTTVKNVTVHFAEGMGLIAQLCDGITLDEFNVCLKGENDLRYFTTQADATHFSQCKGKIISVNGRYENMMDDAINVHGIYLKIMERVDSHTVRGRYMHDQAWGFDWGYAGDTVKFIRTKTMDMDDSLYTIASIQPYDRDRVHGAREFLIRFNEKLPSCITAEASYGIENLTWTPEVYFAHNTIRHNRARGSLFSTPKRTVVEENLFDHTSGSAILLCGDCNGWYETGACRDVVIRKNRFVNALTNLFQFTNAVISIYPEIPDLEGQTTYFHGGKPGAIQITDNVFDTFDAPILYAKSVDGLVFRRNIIRKNTAYPPFHWNRNRFLLERVNRIEIDE